MTISVYVSVSPHEVVDQANDEDLAELVLELCRLIDTLKAGEKDELAELLNIPVTSLSSFADTVCKGAARE